MVAAMSMPVAEVCGLNDSFQAEAIAAIRIVSVTPPVFEQSGCTKLTGAVLDQAGELEASEWFSPAAIGVVPSDVPVL